MKEQALGHTSIPRLFVQYAVPSVAAMLFLGINTIVDGFFVGHFLGGQAMAALNLAIPFSSLVLAISLIVGIGAQSAIGRALGAGDTVLANRLFHTALALMGGIGIILLVLALGAAPLLARLLGANAVLLPLVSEYIATLGWFLPFVGCLMVLDYSLKVIGRPVYAMAALVVSTLLHMGLNYVFLAWLGWGIRGCALATGIAYAAAVALAAWPYCRRQSAVRLGRYAGFETRLAGGILYNGSSEGVTEIGTGVTTFLFNITLMQHAGEAGVTAFSLVGYIAFVSTNVLIGLADGVAAIVSYNYGSRQWARIKAVLQLAMTAALLLGGGLFTAVLCYGGQLITLFLPEAQPDVLRFAEQGAKIYGAAFLFSGWNIVTAGYFTAIGRPQPAVGIAASRGIIWVAAGVVFWPLLFGVQGIWLTMPAAELLTAGVSAVCLLRHWRAEAVA